MKLAQLKRGSLCFILFTAILRREALSCIRCTYRSLSLTLPTVQPIIFSQKNFNTDLKPLEISKNAFNNEFMSFPLDVLPSSKYKTVLSSGNDTDTNTTAVPQDIELQEKLKQFMLSSIKWYRTTLSPIMPPNCRFLPTCSSYGLESIEKYGPWKGGILTAWR
jgi:hypothetical protein